MDYHSIRMRQLLKQDPFLSSVFNDIAKHITNEEAALYYVFEHYVQREPILKNAYLYLTSHS
ncbi:hypothetical protein [Alkalihalobacillus sp. 1P02AB]|uniref:hypothetical protein n=1 Tax=Alkalihalobacillus sp. 1P02AB TaxID=3132260 RepID=UPI0039A733AA